MIAGAYTLDLYCENSPENQEDGLHRYQEFPHQYIDEFGSKCRSRARAAGWKLDLLTGRAWCPKCNSKPGANST